MACCVHGAFRVSAFGITIKLSALHARYTDCFFHAFYTASASASASAITSTINIPDPAPPRQPTPAAATATAKATATATQRHGRLSFWHSLLFILNGNCPKHPENPQDPTQPKETRANNQAEDRSHSELSLSVNSVGGPALSRVSGLGRVSGFRARGLGFGGGF